MHEVTNLLWYHLYINYSYGCRFMNNSVQMVGSGFAPRMCSLFSGRAWFFELRDFSNFTGVLRSKNSRVRFDPEKSPRGPDPFWGQTYPESRSDWPGIRVNWPESESERHFGLRFRSFLHGFHISLTQEWVWPHGTLFRVKSDPGVFRVYWRNWKFIKQNKKTHGERPVSEANKSSASCSPSMVWPWMVVPAVSFFVKFITLTRWDSRRNSPQTSTLLLGGSETALTPVIKFKTCKLVRVPTSCS